MIAKGTWKYYPITIGWTFPSLPSSNLIVTNDSAWNILELKASKQPIKCSGELSKPSMGGLVIRYIPNMLRPISISVDFFNFSFKMHTAKNCDQIVLVYDIMTPSANVSLRIPRKNRGFETAKAIPWYNNALYYDGKYNCPG